MDELGKNFWWKTVGLVIGLGVLGLLCLLLINRLVYRYGFIATLVIFFAILLFFAYRSDKKKQRKYDELEA